MLIKRASELRWSDVTDEGFTSAGASSSVLPRPWRRPARLPAFPGTAAAQGGGAKLPNVKKGPFAHRRDADALRRGHDLQQLLRVRHRQGRSVAQRAHRSRPGRGRVTIDGAVAKGGTFAIDDLVKPHQLEERIYRLRCVEAWSMVIPWVGFPLGDLLKRVEPTPKAKYVEFTTLQAPDQMPGQRRPVLDWPYVEGPAARRGDAPADDPRRRPVRRGAAEPERRAAAAGRAVEVRLQEHQVDRADPPRRAAADDGLGEVGAAGVRLLLQREPRGRSSALEPGQASGASASSSSARR